MTSARTIILNNIAVLCLFLLFLVPSVLSGQTKPGAEARQAGNQLAAVKLIEAKIEKFKEQTIDESKLKMQITSSLAKHKKVLESSIELKKWSNKHLNKEIDNWFEKLPAHINTEDEQWITTQWLKEQKDRYQKEINTAIKDILRTQFPKAFQTVRTKVVNAQRRDITRNSYPSAKEVEKIEQGGKPVREDIKNSLKTVMSGRIELLEENEIWLKKEVINTIIDNALKQLKAQRNLIRKSYAQENFTKTAIINHLNNEITSYVAGLKQNAKPNEKIYEIFPSILEKEIPTRTDILFKDKFYSYIKDKDISQSISPNEIKQIIKNNPSSHYTAQKSFLIIKETARPVIWKKAIAKYSKNIEGSHAFTRQLMELTKTAEMAQLLDRKMNNDLRKPFKRARAEIVSSQLSHFPLLNSGEWEAPEEDIVNYKEKGKKIEIADIGNLFKIKNFQELKNAFLKETTDHLNAKIMGILREGSRSADAQQGLVIRLKKKLKKKFQEDLQDQPGYDRLSIKERHRQYKNRVVNYYTQRVLDAWTPARSLLIWPDRPHQPYMDNKYAYLYNRTKHLIEIIVSPDFFTYEEPPKQPKQKKMQKIQTSQRINNTPTDQVAHSKKNNGQTGLSSSSGGGKAGAGGGIGGGTGPGQGPGKGPGGGGGAGSAGIGGGSATGTICFEASDGTSIESFTFKEQNVKKVLKRLKNYKKIIEDPSNPFNHIPWYWVLFILFFFGTGFYLLGKRAS